MKKLLLTLLGVLLALPTFAFEFEYTYQGQTLEYTVLDEEAKTVAIIWHNNPYEYDNLILPEHPKDGDVEYTLTALGEGAFYDWWNLKSIEIPTSVTTIGNSAFMKCTALKTIEIPNSVTSIGASAFRHCLNLRSVEIPNSVTTIGERAFAFCDHLSTTIIPGSVTSIEFAAFTSCPELRSIYYNTTEPVEASWIFYDQTYTDATLYVPEAAVETFKQIEPWKFFTNIQGYNFSSGVEDVTAGEVGAPYEYFSLSGVKIGHSKDSLVPGIYIVRQGNTTKKIIVK